MNRADILRAYEFLWENELVDLSEQFREAIWELHDGTEQSKKLLRTVINWGFIHISQEISIYMSKPDMDRVIRSVMALCYSTIVKSKYGWIEL